MAHRQYQKFSWQTSRILDQRRASKVINEKNIRKLLLLGLFGEGWTADFHRSKSLTWKLISLNNQLYFIKSFRLQAPQPGGLAKYFQESIQHISFPQSDHKILYLIQKLRETAGCFLKQLSWKNLAQEFKKIQASFELDFFNSISFKKCLSKYWIAIQWLHTYPSLFLAV